MKKRIPFVTLAVVIAASAFWIALGSQVVSYAQHMDFLSFYLGALIARRGDFHHLYDLAFIHKLQLSLFPQSANVVPFTRPPFYAALLAPLTLLPLVPAFWVWVSAQVAALIGCWIWFARRFGYDALIFAALYFPTSVGIYNGQDPVWMLAIFLGSYALAERERDLAAGAVLGLAVAKFHLLLLLPAVLIMKKRWRILAGFCATGAACAAVSVLLGGTSIIEQYAALLLHHGNINTFEAPPELQMSVRSIALNAGFHSPIAAAVLIALCLLALSVAIWRAPLWRWFSAACAATLLVSPHVYRYDAGIMLLPILLAIFCSTSRFTRIVAATAAIPIPYMAAFFGPPYSMAPALVMFLFLIALACESAAEMKRRLPALKILREDDNPAAPAHGTSCPHPTLSPR